MREVDPMRPGRRLSGVPARDREVADLTTAFNGMLDRLEHERRASVVRTLAAQEEERLRISRELHDEVGQTLTAIAIERIGREMTPPGTGQPPTPASATSPAGRWTSCAGSGASFAPGRSTTSGSSTR
jgi:hypothetical protein